MPTPLVLLSLFVIVILAFYGYASLVVYIDKKKQERLLAIRDKVLEDFVSVNSIKPEEISASTKKDIKHKFSFDPELSICLYKHCFYMKNTMHYTTYNNRKVDCSFKDCPNYGKPRCERTKRLDFNYIRRDGRY